ncbi:MAG: zeta toxin family protein [Alphaproteobacteria bacterium]|nr:zeta toxin family protein [Alphaproteobacteria bacterium]
MKSNWKEIIEYRYNKIKCECFENIINSYISKGIMSDNPKIIHCLGIPGAGKSTFCDGHKEIWKDCVRVGFDDIMEKIPNYHEDIKKFGNKIAFSNWEIPARIVGYELIKRIINNKMNMLLDHGGLNITHLNMVSFLQKEGYKIIMYYIHCDVEEALKRAEKREKITLRHTPKEMIISRYKKLELLSQQYREIVDEFYDID